VPSFACGVANLAERETQTRKELPAAEISASLKLAGRALRAVFLLVLIAVTFRVSLPQNETIWTAYDTPQDLIRMALGLGLCGFLGFQLFRAPVDASGYRAWFYLGLAAIPFAIILLIYVW